MLKPLFFAWMTVGPVLLVVDWVSAQNYPTKPVRIVTSSPGGGNDFAARLIAQGISGPLGQPVIVDNRASAVIAAETVAKATPDGYTMLVGGGALWITPLVQKVSYDAMRDFLPISHMTRDINVLVVNPGLPVKSIRELIALAKEKPGVLNYASPGIAAPGQLGAELFKSMAGVNIVGVPYKGNDLGILALMSGEVQMMIAGPLLVSPHVKSGKLRALAVTSAEPSALVPGLPTVAGSGLPGYELIGVTGIWAAARTPSAIITRLNQEIIRVLNRTDVKERYLSTGIEVVGSPPEQFSETIRADVNRMAKVIKDAGIKID